MAEDPDQTVSGSALFARQPVFEILHGHTDIDKMLSISKVTTIKSR